VEAYCFAAAVALAPHGVFVVCENWLNHDRVLRSAVLAKMRVVSVQRVIGRVGKPPLFAVYVMVLKQKEVEAKVDSGVEIDIETECGSIEISDLAVRDENGRWTEEYVSVLRDMGYPVAEC
jgi:hypothetical protein